MSHYNYSANLAKKRLARQSVEAIAIAAKAEAGPSSKTIDFVSLVICSCALTLLCHSLANPPQTSTVSREAQVQSSTSTPEVETQPDLNLYTLTTPQPKVKHER
jgi:hypothetical protein